LVDVDTVMESAAFWCAVVCLTSGEYSFYSKSQKRMGKWSDLSLLKSAKRDSFWHSEPVRLAVWRTVISTIALIFDP
jgi:hypothetical protein